MRYRRVPVPVILVDFVSMYPTVDSRMDLWTLLTASRIEVVDATAEVQQLLDQLTLERCFDPATWRQLVGLAWLQPDNDVLPVRADYAGTGSWTIGIQHYTSTATHCYALPDLVASAILTGKPPQIERAVRLVPAGGPLPGLTPVRLAGEVLLDPARDDFFRAVVEQRQPYKPDATGHPKTCRCSSCQLAAFLKVLANAGSYGILAEVNPIELPSRSLETVELWTGGPQPRTVSTRRPENPGPYCFPPIAACITAGARLMLALLEACVTELGGRWAFCDTDSMAIIATQTSQRSQLADGTQVLSGDDVTAIRRRFDTLNPYTPGTTSNGILEVKASATCLAISAKRYALLPNA